MAASAAFPRSIPWLQAEFAALFVGVPLGIALFLPPRQMFSALFAFTLVGLVLLWRTGGFQWHRLVRGWRRIPWPEAMLLALVVAAAGWIILSIARPGAAWGFVRRDPLMLAAIWALYPLLSALPQELIFRALFFHRYAAILPRGPGALVLNAALFSFAHLMYWNVIVSVMTFVGGYLFARAYRDRGLPAAWLLHAVAGNVLFAVGLGVYFYSGNVVRPF